MLNAFGQGLEYWYRLLDRLIERHRVIIWELRGTADPSPPLRLSDQADDLEAILRHEGIETCHLVGWCTGPKVAIEFQRRHPSAVSSMVFLNASLKCDGSPEELDSVYERNVETLCRMVARQPSMAPSVRAALSPDAQSEAELLKDPENEEMSAGVLALMNVDLKSSVRAPFRNDQTTFNYSRQAVDFWSHDVRPQARDIQVPVFLLSAEYDQVATPAASVAAAELLPRSRHVHVKGATHYCLYDRPEFVAGMLTSFFANPDAFVAQGEQVAGSREPALPMSSK
jgi:pimeloyl-ACP methyl ester carboxylesterase